jgi:hypothetical protein
MGKQRAWATSKQARDMDVNPQMACVPDLIDRPESPR